MRTDLGGFYFHLIFALGLVGIYLSRGWEFLLLVVLLINLDIIHQGTPFVRFDGYWALAELTVIPDFLADEAVLKERASLATLGGNQTAESQVLGKGDIYPMHRDYGICAGVAPLPPRHAAARHHGGSLGFVAHPGERVLPGTGRGDLSGMAMAAVPAFFVALQLMGISYLLYALGRMLVVALWKQLGSG